MKSKEREVKTKIPTVGENDKKPGAIQGILAKIMDSVADDEKGTPNVKKKKQQARDEIVMFLLNDALEDEEKGSPYNIEEARMFSVGIREEIDKYAKRIAGKDKQIRFSPALFRVAMKIWFALQLRMRICLNLAGSCHFQVSNGCETCVMRLWWMRENVFLSTQDSP